MKKALTILGLCFVLTIFAENTNDYSRFENMTKITVPEITTPKVIIMETPDFLAGNTVLLNDKNEAISHKWLRQTENIIPIQNIESSSNFEGIAQNLIDKNHETSLTFDTKDNQKKIILKFAKLTEVSSINVEASAGIIKPRHITIHGVFKDSKKSIIIDNQAFSYHVPFPSVSVTELEISFDTPHFLRVNEIELFSEKQTKTSNKLAFFAENKATYTLYSKPHFGQKYYSAKIYQPLNTDNKTPVFKLPNPAKNSEFNDDFDRDGINDEQDLCPKIIDTENLDIDQNGRGDVCEDPDQDNIMSNKDNCPFVYNPNQKDSDLDKIGDLCDKEENRVSENSEYLLYGIFGITTLFLGFLVMRSFKK